MRSNDWRGGIRGTATTRSRVLLVRGGWTVNIERVHRLWNSLGLRRPLRLRKPRKLGPKRGTSANSCVQQPARFKNDIWTCDFIHDRTVGGRPLKWLTLVERIYSRVPGAACRRFDHGSRCTPDRGPSDWSSRSTEPGSGVTTGRSSFARPWSTGCREWGRSQIPVTAGRPWENGYIESFHSRLRDELLERVEFEDVADAEQRRLGTGGNITRSGLTAHWDMRRPRSLVVCL